MEALEAIKKRRSIRRFEKKDVEDEKIFELMECARQAPSAHNDQPWFFFVVKNEKMRKELAKVHRYAGFLENAPVGIVCCSSDESKWYLQDCCAAIENLLVGAKALGLGTCWIGVHGKESCEEYVQKIIETDLRVINLIALGYPKEEPSVKKRPLEKIFKIV